MYNLLKTAKKGMSLIEMMVAISIFTIGIGGFTLLFANSWKSNSFILEEGMASIQASNAIRKISSQLREIRQSDDGQYMVKAASANELVVYLDSDSDGDVERVRYFLDDANDMLKKGVAEPSVTPLFYPEGYDSDTVTNTATYVMNSGESEPVFKYYGNNNNNQLSSSPSPTDIRVIEINLWVNIKPQSAPENVKIGTSVDLRNIDEGM